MRAISHKYSIPPASQKHAAANKAGPVSPPGRYGATRQPSTHTDWVATTVNSQTPLSPFSNSGLDSASISPGKTVYDRPAHSKMVKPQKTFPTPGASYRITHPLPSTPVAATTVKNPGARAWATRSARKADQYQAHRATARAQRTA